MKVGKISEVALSRAVLKQLNNKRDEVLLAEPSEKTAQL